MFIEYALKHHYYHIQIGGENEFTQDLRAAGLHVEVVMGNNDLVDKVIDITDKMYRGIPLR